MIGEQELALYRLLAAPGLGEAALGQVLAAWREEPALLSTFWGRRASAYRTRWRLSERAAHHLQDDDPAEGRATAESAAARAREAEIETLTVMDGAYAALAERRALPSLLFTRGNQDLLWGTGVAIPHSSDAAETALAWGAALAGVLADAGIGLVSGHNRDGYRRTAAAAKRARAPLVIVLDRPLHGSPASGPQAEPVATARLWDDQFRPERELIVSPFRPGEAWMPRHARTRDGLVIGIAGVVVAGGVRPAGTIAAGCEQASAAGRPVFRSAFCRAPLLGHRLPPEIKAAADVIVKAVGQEEPRQRAAASPLPGHADRRTGWRERRWAEVGAAFVEALQAALGSGGWVEAAPTNGPAAGDPALGWVPPPSLAWRDTPIVAVIFVPAACSGQQGQAIVVGRRLPVSHRPGAEAPPAVLLTPSEPLGELEALRGYLTRCMAKVEAALRTLRPAVPPAPDRSPTQGAPPSPE